MPGSSLGRHLESGVDPGNEVDVLARCARGKIKANNMADIEEEILLQANLFLLLVLKRRQVSFKT